MRNSRCFCAYDDHGCSVHPLAGFPKLFLDHGRTKVDITTDSEYRRLQACRDQAEENHTNAIIRRVQAYDAEESARGELNRCKRQLEDHIKTLTDRK